MIVPVVLGFYILVAIFVVLFNCWKIFSGAIVRRLFEKRKLECRMWFWCEAIGCAQEGPAAQEKMIAKVSRRLHWRSNLLAFHAAMDEVQQAEPEIYKTCEPLLAQIVRRIFPKAAGRQETKQAYYSFLVARFAVMQYAPGELITAFLLEQVRDHRSLYNLENALRAIYTSNDVPLVMQALRLLDSEDGVFIHEKLLVDGLLTFSAPDALIAAIWAEFENFAPQMKKLLLDYIRFASGAWKERVLQELTEAQEFEIKISCLRYFGKYPDERVRPVLYDFSREPDGAQWELCAVAMTVLAAYPGGETVELLKKGLCSRNWHIRYNAALSLRALRVDAQAVQDILSGSDRYAKQMLQYRLGMGESAAPGEEAAQV